MMLEIGWVQAIAAAAVAIAAITALTVLAERCLAQLHERAMKRLEHKQRAETAVLADVSDGTDDDGTECGADRLPPAEVRDE